MNSKSHSSRTIACLILIGGLLLALAWPAPADPTAAESRLSLPDDFSGYRHIHSLVINDPESPLYGFHHFYVNEIGWKTFAN